MPGGLSPWHPLHFKMRVFLSAASFLFFAGCLNTDAEFDIETNESVGLATEQIHQFAVSIPDGGEILLTPTAYLERHSAVILNDSKELQNQSGLRISSNQDLTPLLEDDWSSKTSGMAVPITNDGYFLTALHVVLNEDTDSSILYMVESESGEAGSSQGQRYSLHIDTLRVVFQNSEVDFAIIKADIAPPRYLELRDTPIDRDEVLHAGGRHNETAKGNLNRFTNEILSQGEQFIALDAAFLTRPGDSGSAVIDEQGLLCGVVSGTFRGSTIAVTLPPDRIMTLIEIDRTAHKAPAPATDLSVTSSGGSSTGQ